MPWCPDCHYDWFHADDHTRTRTYTRIFIVLKFWNATGHAASVFQPPRRINASLKESPGCHGNICQKSLHIVSSTFSARLPPPTAVPGLLPVTAHHHLLLPLQANNIFVGEKVSRLARLEWRESPSRGWYVHRGPDWRLVASRRLRITGELFMWKHIICFSFQIRKGC